MHKCPQHNGHDLGISNGFSRRMLKNLVASQSTPFKRISELPAAL
jgi:hypothetical protein